MAPRIKRARLQHTCSLIIPNSPHERYTRFHRQQSRPFGSTPQYRSKLRQQMFDWLDGPGNVFRNPLPGSTNYLSAYDQRGRLIRDDRGAGEAAEKADGKENEPPKAHNDEDGLEEQVTPLKDNKATLIPRESSQDLEPFPMNRQFRSQPVLSEEFREEIWKRVVVQGQSIRFVSTELNVEMSRVGAVVRLKSVEKQWQQQVELSVSFNVCTVGSIAKTLH